MLALNFNILSFKFLYLLMMRGGPSVNFFEEFIPLCYSVLICCITVE